MCKSCGWIEVGKTWRCGACGHVNPVASYPQCESCGHDYWEPKNRSGISKETLGELKRRAGGLCEICKRPPDFRGLSPHHIKPRSLGGSDDMDNLILVCGRDHSKKHGIREA